MTSHLWRHYSQKQFIIGLSHFSRTFFTEFGEYGFRWPFSLEILDSRISTVAVHWWFSCWLLINMTHADSFIDCLIKNDLSVCSNCNMFYCLFIYLDKRISKYFEWQFSLANQKTKTNRPRCFWWFVRRVWWWARTVVNLWATSKVWRIQNWSSVKKKSGKTILEGRMVETSTCWIISTSRKALEIHVQGPLSGSGESMYESYSMSHTVWRNY